MAVKVVKGWVVPLFISPGFVSVDFMTSMDRSAQANSFQKPFFAAHSARLNDARTAVVEAFLNQTNAEWAWFLDADMVFKADVLPRLLQTAKEKRAKVVGGLCFILNKQKGTVYPNIFMEHHERKPGEKRYKHVAVYPRDEPFEVDGTGGACLLVHREVLEAVGEKYKDAGHPWQEERIDSNTGTYEGEDLVFCQKVRECGYSIWYEPRAQLGHLKEVSIGVPEYEAFMRKNQDRLVLVG